MQIADVLDMAAEIMGENGIAAEWSLRIGRKKRTLGVCYFDEKVIELSQYFIELNNADEVRDVILHEVAHALAGPGTGHGPVWARTAVRLGAKPQALNHTAVQPPARWVGICVHGRHLLDRYRKPRNLNWYCTCDNSRM